MQTVPDFGPLKELYGIVPDDPAGVPPIGVTGSAPKLHVASAPRMCGIAWFTATVYHTTFSALHLRTAGRTAASPNSPFLNVTASLISPSPRQPHTLQAPFSIA